MSKIQFKILLVLLMTVTVIGGYTVFLGRYTPKLKSQYTMHVSYMGTIKTGGKVAIIRPIMPHSKLHHRRSEDTVSYKSTLAVSNVAKLSPGSLTGDALRGNYTLASSGKYHYNKRITKNNYRELNGSATAMIAPGLLASGKKAFGGVHDGRSSAMPASLASTTYKSSLTPDLRFAPNSTDNLNEEGNPGGDPETPVGDGVWVMLLFAAGYLVYRKKFWLT